MSKPFKADDLASQLTQDITWRIREISDLKSTVQIADITARPAILRAMMAMMYAHWEGHVRFCAQKYLQHVALRKLLFAVLDRQFLKGHFLPKLNSISQKSDREKGELIDGILDSQLDRFSRVNDDLVNTKSNLSHRVLGEICRVCGIEIKHFEGQDIFIDLILLKRRNAIAHGEETFIQLTEVDGLADQTIALMRTFSNQIQMVAYLERYRAVKPS